MTPCTLSDPFLFVLGVYIPSHKEVQSMSLLRRFYEHSFVIPITPSESKRVNNVRPQEFRRFLSRCPIVVVDDKLLVPPKGISRVKHPPLRSPLTFDCHGVVPWFSRLYTRSMYWSQTDNTERHKLHILQHCWGSRKLLWHESFVDRTKISVDLVLCVMRVLGTLSPFSLVGLYSTCLFHRLQRVRRWHTIHDTIIG